MTKLDWQWRDRQNDQVAQINDRLRVRAVQDSDASNPFEESEGHWPMLVRVGGERSTSGKYENPGNAGVAISTPLNGASLSSCRTPDALLIHDQRAFARAVGYTMANPIQVMLDEYSNLHDITDPTKHCRDGKVLRECLIAAVSDMNDSDRFEALEAIYKLLDIPALNTTVRGYSQGDWADILIVAVPELQAQFWGETVRSPDEIMADLRGQADLYGSWAWGDVYGYIIEELPEGIDPDDADDDDWTETDSCWGYYGTDHSKSGLEEAARECLPTEARTLEAA